MKGERVIKSIKISAKHDEMLERIRDHNRHFNLSGEVECLVERVYELIKDKATKK